MAIVKIEKVGEDETGGLLLQVDSGQGDGANQMHRMGHLEEEQEYDESDLTGEWSQEDISNEGSLHQEGDQSGSGGAMYMGPTSGRCLFSFYYHIVPVKILSCHILQINLDTGINFKKRCEN